MFHLLFSPEKEEEQHQETTTNFRFNLQFWTTNIHIRYGICFSQMKRKILIQEEIPSNLVAPIRYCITMPSPGFIRTEILTVFPDLKVLYDAEREREASLTLAATTAAESPQEESHSPSSSNPASPNADSASLKKKNVFIISTFQPCDIDNLITYNDGSVDFKDISRDRFFALMAHVEERLGVKRRNCAEDAKITGGDGQAEESDAKADADSKHCGWYIDYPDPATGIPVYGHATSTSFCETDAIELLLKMELMYVNGCRMIIHPKFKENVYPASAILFGEADGESFKALMDGI